MGVLRVHTHPHDPAPFPVELAQPVGVRGQLRGTDKGKIERVEEEEGVAGFGGVGGVDEEIGEGDGADLAVFDGFGRKAGSQFLY